MLTRLRLLFFLLITSTCIYAQEEEYETTLVEKPISLTNFYIAKVPEKIDQALLLLPGFGQPPATIFMESELPEVAFKNNTLCFAFAAGPKIYADDTVVSQMNKLITHAVEKYQLEGKPFVIGGFSAGGTVALRYAELCHEKKNCPMLPKGVFTVDSPIDLFGLWEYLKDEIKKDYAEIGVNEAKFVKNLMTKEYGSLPKNKTIYESLTPFHWELDDLGNEKHLMDIAVRTYHDVDIPWLLENRRRSAFDANFLYASEMINRLLLNGHENAEFIQGETGYRRHGQRHPHSWSIVDEVECIAWIKKICQ